MERGGSRFASAALSGRGGRPSQGLRLRLPSGTLPSHRYRMLILNSLILEEPQCSGPLAQSFISTSKQQIYWFSCEFYILLTNPQSPSRVNSTICVLPAICGPPSPTLLSKGLGSVQTLGNSVQLSADGNEHYTFLLQTASYSRHSRHPCPSVFSSWHQSIQTLVQTVPMMLGSTLTAAVIQVPLNTVTLQCLTASSTPKLTCPGKEKVFSLLKKQLWCFGGGMDGQKDRHTRETRMMCRFRFAVSLSFYLCGGVCV